ncbi:hypothetical protein N7539_002197 [Penicillium diatomitis]|uniref:Uncharacterized protein n=1 Tax=Penicillium diatomitis TaxID=2819901 RepID=A0A9X0C0L6_9EURO|nr:uncharacterized protein N7539_002197 [Penicillium diatomitis]KAJ5493451.1 hypothetical protein N7539_002197 [Penicillium diatomitis]
MSGPNLTRNISYGRGGAGNIAPPQRSTTPKDLVTPTIKQEVYTTGRGGSGNMVQNDPQHPELARESQDVESPPLRAEQFPHHTGRGGAANAYIPTPEEEQSARKEEAELVRVRTQSRDRLKEIELKRQEERHGSPAS